MTRTLAIALLFASSFASAQGLQISSGDSTITNAMGAEVKMVTANSEVSLAGGVVSGHVVGGATEATIYRGLNIHAGDVMLPFGLMTDYTAGSIQFSAVGLGVSKGDAKTQTSWTAFAGATSTQYIMPFFYGAKTSSPMAAFFFTHHINPAWTFTSSEVLSDTQTSIQELAFHPFTPLTFAVGAGFGSNAPFASGRIGWKSEHLNGVLNYTKRAANFQRVILPYTTLVENDGLNASLGFTSRPFTFTADHTNTLSALKTGIIASTVNSVSASGSLSFFSANSSVFFGESAGKNISGQTAGIGISEKFLTVQTNWYRSASGSQVSGIVTEKITRHVSVNQYIQKDAVNFGGEYHANLITVSAGYSTSYFPVLDAFEKVFSAQITLQLPNAMTVTGGTVTTPDGKTRWSVYGTKFGQGNMTHAEPVSGKYEYSGAVVTVDGLPVLGAAVMLGKTEVFTNKEGIFLMPSRKRKTLAVKVLVNDFMAPGKWLVVSGPMTIAPDEHVQIVVTIVNP